MSKKLLIVEDDKNISYIITENAKIEGYEIEAAFDGEQGLEFALNGKYDLIILDLMLPKIDGFEICKRVRAANIITPVIMVTARKEEVDKILGLELGADDYITKPFSVKEMFARIKANIRRNSGENDLNNLSSEKKLNENIIKIGSLIIDNEKYKVEKDGVLIDLTKLEFDLLSFLASSPEKIFAKAELLKNVWRDDFYNERTVDTAITRLRAKIGDKDDNSKIIHNKRGIGYYLHDSNND